MQGRGGYRTIPFSVNRLMVAASARIGRERNNIHGILEVDVSKPRRLLRDHRELTGERLSMTAYVVACVARAVSQQPEVNSFRRGGRLILLDDVTINVLVERDIGGEKVPDSLGIRAAQAKTYRQINDEIRAAQGRVGDRLGDLLGMGWVVRLIPSFMFRAFIRAASRSIAMARRYGKVAVTAVGMFGKNALWFIPLNAGTVAVTIGSIIERVVRIGERFEPHEHLCLTLSFDHDIVDGAPAARFAKRLVELLEDGEALRDAVSHGLGPTAAR
jgi:pyruvate/2-oxoglutarate dehydrogenase complex dihydrolipoamide acyltransferase (E2) component